MTFTKLQVARDFSGVFFLVVRCYETQAYELRSRHLTYQIRDFTLVNGPHFVFVAIGCWCWCFIRCNGSLFSVQTLHFFIVIVIMEQFIIELIFLLLLLVVVVVRQLLII